MVGNVFGNAFAYLMLDIIHVVFFYSSILDNRIYLIEVMDGMVVSHGYLLV